MFLTYLRIVIPEEELAPFRLRLLACVNLYQHQRTVNFLQSEYNYTIDHDLPRHSWSENGLLAIADHSRNARHHR